MISNIISSTKNDRLKGWLQLQKSKVRQKSEVFLVEGFKECIRGINADYKLRGLMLCPAIISDSERDNLLALVDPDGELFELHPKVYAKLAYRKETEGVIGLFEKKIHTLEAFPLNRNKNTCFLILENIEKPGNLGAILRTADAVKAEAVILTGKSIDQYNPNVIRASIGTLFTVPVVQAGAEEIISWAKENNVKLYGTALPAYTDLYELKLDHSAAFLFGAEDTGLTDFWLQNTDKNITIPMLGIADSLNLSVSAAIVSYEFYRQNTL